MSDTNYKIEIPERFYSDTENKPFEHCQVCDKYLLEDNTSYVVEKAIKNYEGYDFYSTIYEYAICSDCHTAMQAAMSKESQKRLQEYYMDVMTSRNHGPLLIDTNNFKLNDWLSKCFFTGKNISEMKEYQLVAQFSGPKLVINTPPIVVGEEAMEEMSSLLSEKTVDEMNRFKKLFFGPDPELEEFIYGKKLIFV